MLPENKKWVINEYNKKATGKDFRNRLLGQDLTKYSAYHHFGIGKINSLNKILARNDNKELKELIYSLEKAESNHLVNLFEGRLTENSKVLDCGSGSGGTAFDLNKKYNCVVTGINFANKQTKFTNKIAKLKNVDNKIKFQYMDMENIEFSSNSFDAAYTNETAEYVNLDSFFSGISRILKNKGVYASIDWCRSDEHPSNNKYADSADSYYRTQMHPVNEFKKELKNNGFKILKFNNLTEQAVDYWKIRKHSSISSKVDTAFLEGYEKGYLSYISFLAEVQK